MMPKRFSGVNIRQVDFNYRKFARADCVPQRNTCVGIGGSIQDDSVNDSSGLLNPGDQIAFGVALSEIDFHLKLSSALANQNFHVLEGSTAVDFGLARSQKVEIRTIKEKNFHIRFFGLVN